MKRIHYESVTERSCTTQATDTVYHVSNWKPSTCHKRFVQLENKLQRQLGHATAHTQHSQVRSLTVTYTDHGDLFILLVMIL